MTNIKKKEPDSINSIQLVSIIVITLCLIALVYMFRGSAPQLEESRKPQLTTLESQVEALQPKEQPQAIVEPPKTEVKPEVVQTPPPAPTPVVEASKPASKPIEKPKPKASVGAVEQIVRNAARKYGINEEHFVRIARCESTFNPNAVNKNYYENGHPSGLFQHLSGYWPKRAATYGHAGASVFDPVANAEVTAQMFRDGQSGLWECR